jgi:hypothetical protein
MLQYFNANGHGGADVTRSGVGPIGLGAALLAATVSGPACGLDRAGKAQVADDAAAGIRPWEDGEISG